MGKSTRHNNPAATNAAATSGLIALDFRPISVITMMRNSVPVFAKLSNVGKPAFNTHLLE